MNSDNLEPEIRDAFRLILDLQHPKTFWDIGANIGFYSWYVRNTAQIREVVMFEPDPTNFELITRTITRNSICNCRALNVALSDKAGEASFLLDLASGATGTLQAVSARHNEQSLHRAYMMKETVVCRTATIDGLVLEGLTPPEFMKIDVEGAEPLVLAGAQSVLRNRHPTMIVETANISLIQSLRESGYNIFRIDEGNLLFLATESDVNLDLVRRRFHQILS